MGRGQKESKKIFGINGAGAKRIKEDFWNNCFSELPSKNFEYCGTR
jgi:hypothetical protein